MQDSCEQLRKSTARLKSWRLKLPHPGTLLRVKSLTFLSTVRASLEHGFASPVDLLTYESGEFLLLVYVNTEPMEHPKGKLVDPVELIFIGRDGALVSSGTRAAADALLGYDIV